MQNYKQIRQKLQWYINMHKSTDTQAFRAADKMWKRRDNHVNVFEEALLLCPFLINQLGVCGVYECQVVAYVTRFCDNFINGGEGRGKIFKPLTQTVQHRLMTRCQLEIPEGLPYVRLVCVMQYTIYIVNLADLRRHSYWRCWLLMLSTIRQCKASWLHVSLLDSNLCCRG